MKTFNEWIKENMHMGRPYGQMGVDGRIYGHSTGPVGRISGTNTWKSNEINSTANSNSKAEGLWKANNPITRLSYLSEFPNAKELNLHTADWNDLPPEAQEVAISSMFGRSPFK